MGATATGWATAGEQKSAAMVSAAAWIPVRALGTINHRFMMDSKKAGDAGN